MNITDSKTVEERCMFKPDSTSVCDALECGLRQEFRHVSVEEVDCPDLTNEPWNLAMSGICGSPTLVDVGGVPNLIPLPDKSKIYNFDEIASSIGMPDAFFIGAGAGSCRILGKNSEMMANVKVGADEKLGTFVATVDEQMKCQLDKFPHKEFCLLGNFLASEGKSGKVIKVSARERTGTMNFVSCMRKALEESQEEFCGLGGTFLIRRGKAKLHVMPDFSSTPLNTDEDVDSWLQFYEMDAPLVCLSVFYNRDPGLDLRIEHTHCFSNHGAGGHYHCDVTPDEVDYTGFFVVAERVVRIDRPRDTHNVGRD